MEIEEYGKYLKQKTLGELIGIKERIDKGQHPDRYEMVNSEIENRNSGIDAEEADLKVPTQNTSNNPYVGFWKRLGAYLLDLIILLPIIYISVWGGDQSRLFSLYYLVPGILFGVWFHAYLVKRYGGTPGKLLLNIKITKLDGAPAGYQEALLRYSVLMVLSTVMSIAAVMVAFNMSDELYFSMEWMERSKYINENMPSWHFPILVLMNVWVWGEFIVMLTNKERRALHDFMAGTIVVHSGTEKLLSNQANSIDHYRAG